MFIRAHVRGYVSSQTAANNQQSHNKSEVQTAQRTGQTLIDERKFTFTLHHKCPSTEQQIPLCLAQKLTESGSLRSLEHCRESCAVYACNLSTLHEHTWNHARFVLHYCRSAPVCTGP